MNQPSSSVYRLGKGPALAATGACVIAAGLLVFLAFLLADDATGRMIATSVVAVLAIVVIVMAVRFAVRPPAIVRLDAAGFSVSRPRARAAWKQVEDVIVEDGILVLKGEGTARVDLRLLDPERRTPFLRDVHERLNTAYGYTRFG